MGRKKGAALAGRAWNLLRLALLWARKGEVFRRRLAADLRLVPSYVRSLRAAAAAARSDDVVRYAEREFSFDETPIIHLKMHRPRSMRMPHLPCINPPVHFEDDVDDGDDVLYGRGDRMSWLRRADENGKERGEEEVEVEEEEEEEEGKCIDVKAEEFIAKFYEQMKFQRQFSLLQYQEMLLRSSS